MQIEIKIVAEENEVAKVAVALAALAGNADSVTVGANIGGTSAQTPAKETAATEEPAAPATTSGKGKGVRKTAAEKKAEAEAAAEAEKKDAAKPDVSFESLREQITSLSPAQKAVVRELFKKYDATKLSEVPEDDLVDFKADMDKALAAAPAEVED